MNPRAVTITDVKTFSDLRFLSSLWMILSLNELNMDPAQINQRGFKNIKNTAWNTLLILNKKVCNSITMYTKANDKQVPCFHTYIYVYKISAIHSLFAKKRRFHFRMKANSDLILQFQMKSDS